MTKITFEEVMKKLEKREQKTRVFVDELWNDFNQLKDAENLEEAYQVLTQISQLECLDNFFDDSLSSKISAQVSKEEFIKFVKEIVVENRYTSASFAYDYEGYGYSSSSLFC